MLVSGDVTGKNITMLMVSDVYGKCQCVSDDFNVNNIDVAG